MGATRLTNSNYFKQWPATLQRAAKHASASESTAGQPLVIEMTGSKSVKELEELVTNQRITLIVDNYDEQLAELFISQNAQLYKAPSEVKTSSIKDYLAKHYRNRPTWQQGSWVYYPWSGELVHLLGRDLFWQLRTVRNHYLITEEEQRLWAKFRVGCAGLSVGSNGAQAIVLTGGSEQLKLADGAVLSGSNLNRMRAGVA